MARFALNTKGKILKEERKYESSMPLNDYLKFNSHLLQLIELYKIIRDCLCHLSGIAIIVIYIQEPSSLSEPRLTAVSPLIFQWLVYLLKRPLLNEA